MMSITDYVWNLHLNMIIICLVSDENKDVDSSSSAQHEEEEEARVSTSKMDIVSDQCCHVCRRVLSFHNTNTSSLPSALEPTA